MKQFENGHILFFIFFVIVKWELGWFRAVLRLTDSLFLLLLLFFFVMEKVGCYLSSFKVVISYIFSNNMWS